MKKIILILILAVVVLMSCNPSEDPIQLNEDPIQINNPENIFVKELIQKKAVQSMFSEYSKNSNSKNGNNSNGVLFTVDGEFWILGFGTNIPGVYAYVYETGFVDIKLFPQENRLEFFMHTNDVNLFVMDYRGDYAVEIYNNFCLDEIAVANFKIQTEYWTRTTDEGDIVYLWNWGRNTYTSDTGILNVKMDDAYVVDGECTEPTTNKRLKMTLVNTPNSNSPNSAEIFKAKILDH